MRCSLWTDNEILDYEMILIENELKFYPFEYMNEI